ncbi:unnamed protein product [Didymodactylos carnosus]|uniref:EGF-like domain-containing protein n=1 Tax=Didymodactylos carnosus TaxID=1234261 RepID=A0A814TMX1_9BILA|nr:unnamed protein product [Didymodactylos carnosus]CAF3927240.1 unnamed protein product [Didymodactylos carnosus]
MGMSATGILVPGVQSFEKSRTMMKTLFLYFIFTPFIECYFHLHYTDEQSVTSLAYKHCLYLYVKNEKNLSVESLIPYCIRSPTFDHSVEIQCYGKEYRFDDLKLLEITVDDLYGWNAPIDMMNNYQKYRLGLSTNANQLYCNCTDNHWFGPKCEYTLGQSSEQQVEIVIRERFKMMDRYYNPRTENITCYNAIPCESIVCIDWRDICNGIVNCKGGEDELNCLELEMSECNLESEYRCRNGQCIPKTFAYDHIYDCMDSSDELISFTSVFHSCYTDFSLHCEEHNCGWLKFSCGYGECAATPVEEACDGHRAQLYQRKLFEFESDKNISILCWKYMICVTTNMHLRLAYLFNISCEDLCPPFGTCSDFLRLTCSNIYSFPSIPFMYPSVHLLYDSERYNFHHWKWTPIFICYDDNACKLYPTNLIINNYSCREFYDERDAFSFHAHALEYYPKLYYYLKQLFYYCPIQNCSDYSSTLFKCSTSEKCISKYRVKDGVSDCHRDFDEQYNDVCNFNLSKHFKCFSSTNECILRTKLLDSKSDCTDNSDELYPIKCQTPNDLGCRYMQGFAVPISYFLFQEICNGIIHDELRSSDNDTDETDCSEWQLSCSTRYKLCNGMWNCADQWMCTNKRERVYKQFTFTDFSQNPPRGATNEAVVPTPVALEDALPKLLVSPYLVHHCNRGIVLTSKQGRDECLCPPSYKGTLCEYQSKRLTAFLQIETSAAFGRSVIFKLVISVVSNNNSIDDREEITHVPYIQTNLYKHTFYLIYPEHSNDFFVHIDVFRVDVEHVEFISSWYYPIPFKFLPANRLAVRLTLNITRNKACDKNCSHGVCMIYENAVDIHRCICDEGWSGAQCDRASSTIICSPGSKLVDSSDRCVCPLGKFGPDCFARIDPCSHKLRCYNEGTCVPLDMKGSKYVCLCTQSYFGNHCEHSAAKATIYLSDISRTSIQNLPIVVVHLLDVYNNISVMSVEERYVFKDVRIRTSLTVFREKHIYLPNFVYVQVFFDINNLHSEYYLVALLKHRVKTQKTNMLSANRCPYVSELLNSTIMNKFSTLNRYKFYYKACFIQSVKCFFDKNYLCLCDNEARLECLVFDHTASNCTSNGYCLNSGYCVQPVQKEDKIEFECLCRACYHGNLCQFSTTQYSMSLDAVIGSNVLAEMPLAKQPTDLKVTFIFVILLVAIGFLFNLLSLITFFQQKTQEAGCGFYLFSLCIVSQLGLFMFAAKFIYLLKPQRNKMAAYWTCVILELFLKILPSTTNWLTACVAIERTVTVIKGVKFDKVLSKKVSRYVVFTVIVGNIVSYLHQSFIRHVIEDPRSNGITWCVMKFSHLTLEKYDMAINIIHLIVPFCINIMTTLILLISLTQPKFISLTAISNVTYYKLLKEQMVLYKPFVLSPFVLVILQIPHLLLSFTLVCIESNWQKYFYLITYFVSCLPLTGTLVIFVLPSPVYKKEFIKCIIRATSRSTV